MLSSPLPAYQRPFFSLVQRMVEASTLLIAFNSYIAEKGTYPPGLPASLTSSPDFKSKLNNLAFDTLDLIGTGSSRAVFSADPSTVLKVALNPAGKAQNREEGRNWSGRNPILPKVFQVSSDGSWLEMEKVTPAEDVRYEIFAKRFFGIPDLEDLVQNIMVAGVDGYPKRATPDQRTNIDNLMRFVNSSDTLLGDIFRIKNWGTTMRNGKLYPIYLDYGTTKETFKQHYVPRIIPQQIATERY
jgi:hypothetical protein